MMGSDVQLKSRDKYGFTFWLAWILQFAGSFLAAALAGTVLYQKIFGAVRGLEIILSWMFFVFGGWFLILVPFMRKKEQIWKRLNPDQEKSVNAWLLGMGLLIGMLILSSTGWSIYYAQALRAGAHRGLHPAWAKAVFGTWGVLFIPWLVFMYRRADDIFKNAVKNQTHIGPRFKTALVEQQKRRLSGPLVEKLKTIPVTVGDGQVVTLVLNDGRQVPHVFVHKYREILGVYDRSAMDFDAAEVCDVKVLPGADLPRYEESRWLRLNGRA